MKYIYQIALITINSLQPITSCQHAFNFISIALTTNEIDSNTSAYTRKSTKLSLIEAYLKEFVTQRWFDACLDHLQVLEGHVSAETTRNNHAEHHHDLFASSF